MNDGWTTPAIQPANKMQAVLQNPVFTEWFKNTQQLIPFKIMEIIKVLFW